MHIHYDSFSHFFIPSLGINSVPSWIARHKTIFAVAALAFGCLAGLYLLMRYLKPLSTTVDKVDAEVETETEEDDALLKTPLPETCEAKIENEDIAFQEIDETKKGETKTLIFIFNEILQTEKTYKSNLEELAQFEDIYRERKQEWIEFVKPREQRNLKKCFGQLFKLIHRLRKLSNKIFKELDELKVDCSEQEWTVQFEKFHNKFQEGNFALFGQFAELHDEMTRIFNIYHATDPKKMLQNEVNNVFVQHIDAMYDFDDMMIAPIQRMPRYQLLLLELRRNTLDGSPRAESLDHLLTIATQSNQSNNERVKTTYFKKRALTDSQFSRLKRPELFTLSKKRYLDLCTKENVLNWRRSIDEQKLWEKAEEMKKVEAQIQNESTALSVPN